MESPKGNTQPKVSPPQTPNSSTPGEHNEVNNSTPKGTKIEPIRVERKDAKPKSPELLRKENSAPNPPLNPNHNDSYNNFNDKEEDISTESSSDDEGKVTMVKAPSFFEVTTKPQAKEVRSYLDYPSPTLQPKLNLNSTLARKPKG